MARLIDGHLLPTRPLRNGPILTLEEYVALERAPRLRAPRIDFRDFRDRQRDRQAEHFWRGYARDMQTLEPSQPGRPADPFEVLRALVAPPPIGHEGYAPR